MINVDNAVHSSAPTGWAARNASCMTPLDPVTNTATTGAHAAPRNSALPAHTSTTSRASRSQPQPDTCSDHPLGVSEHESASDECGQPVDDVPHPEHDQQHTAAGRPPPPRPGAAWRTAPAKKLEAVNKISSARLSSQTSASNFLIRAASAVVVPGASSSSVRRCLAQLRWMSGTIPRLGEIRGGIGRVADGQLTTADVGGKRRQLVPDGEGDASGLVADHQEVLGVVPLQSRRAVIYRLPAEGHQRRPDVPLGVERDPSRQTGPFVHHHQLAPQDGLDLIVGRRRGDDEGLADRPGHDESERKDGGQEGLTDAVARLDGRALVLRHRHGDRGLQRPKVDAEHVAGPAHRLVDVRIRQRVDDVRGDFPR
jgi:hypothetical protein